MMNRADPVIANYVNSNLSDACRLAKRVRSLVIYQALRARFGKNEGQALAITKYLKAPSQATFDAACKAEFMQCCSQCGEPQTKPMIYPGEAQLCPACAKADGWTVNDTVSDARLNRAAEALWPTTKRP